MASAQDDGLGAGYLAGLNSLAIELAAARLDTDPVPMVIDRLRGMTGAIVVNFCPYDEASRSLRLAHTSADGAILSRLQQILGYVLRDLQMPVSPEMYREMTTRVFARVPDLTTLTLGAIPRPLSATLEHVFGLGEKVVLMFQREGRLFGTSSLLMPGGRPELPDAILEVSSNLVSAALSRYRAERRVVESEERFRAIFDAVSDAIFVHDAESGDILEANARTTEMFGYTADDLRRLGMAAVSGGDGAYTAGEALAHIRATAAGSPRLFEWRCRRKDGSVFWGEVNMRRASLSGAPRVLVLVRDVTARKDAALAQARIEDEVSHAQRMESIGRLAGGVAHDFNNLLTAIIGNVELVSEDLAPAHPAQERLRDAVKAADSAAALTSQLLAFGRKQMILPRVLDLNEVVASAARLLSRLIGEHISVVVSTGRDACPVRVDPVQIEQVIVNLAMNARDSMPAGGRLGIESSTVTLDESYCRAHPWASPGTYARLSVTDTGAGMSEDVLRHVFEPFFSTKPLGKGTGLGLAMVYGAVKQNGGLIDIESAPGRGTSVRVFLPPPQDPLPPQDPQAS